MNVLWNWLISRQNSKTGSSNLPFQKVCKLALGTVFPVKQLTKSCFRWPKSLRKASGCHNFLSSNSADLQTRTGWPLIHWSWNILMLFSCLGSSSNNNLPPQSHWWGAVCFLWSRWHETCCGGWILASENYKDIFTSV